MIRLVSICLFMLIFCSCSSEVVSRITVVKRYPNAEIVSIPNVPYRWIVRKNDGSIWLVWASDIVANESTEVELLKGRVCE
jgi:hypothetical protein